MPRSGLVLVAAALVGATACASLRSSPPARDGAESIIATLAGDDPRAAYELLSQDARGRVSFEEFRLQWEASSAERAWQAARLREALATDPDAGERASATYSDGKVVALVRDRGAWRLDAALVSRTRAARPREAIRRFAEAIRARDLQAFLASLTSRRREGLERQLSAFSSGFDRQLEGTIEEIGVDRAELRWDEGGMRYTITVRKEGDDWRIDDVQIQRTPARRDDDDE